MTSVHTEHPAELRLHSGSVRAGRSKSLYFKVIFVQ